MADEFTDIQPIQASGEFTDVVPINSTGIAAPQGIAPSVSGRDIFTGMAQGTANTVGSSVSGMARLLNMMAGPGVGKIPEEGISSLESITAARSKPQNLGQKIGRTGEQIGEFLLPTGFEAKAVSLLPKAMQGARFIPSLTRVAVVGGETGIRSASQGSDFGTGAAVGAATGVVGEIGRVAAPKLIEKALGVLGKDTQYGKTPGQALLENTSALTPGGIAKQAQKASSGLTGEMEAGVRGAKALPGNPFSTVMTTEPAHEVIDNAIKNAPRNATTYKDKLDSLRRLLTLDSTGRKTFTPDEILELKRGIAKEISAWDIGSKKAINPVARQIYGALDKQLDAAIPGNDVLNQRISSLIAGSKAANATAIGRSRSGLAAATHLVGKGILPSLGFGAGYAHGGTGEGLALGTAGLVLQTPAAQIAIARLIKSGLPERLARGIVAGGLLNQGGK